MGTWHEESWISSITTGMPGRDRRSGTYAWYLPTPLSALSLHLSQHLAEDVARAERAVRALNSAEGSGDLAGLARFLLRSEAIASSRIEGIAPAATQVALAELSDHEDVAGFSSQAQLVARNMTLVRQASSELAGTDRLTVEAIVELHRALLDDEPRHHGLRSVQNWIGGSDHHPLDADFVPPAPAKVPNLMQDLVDHMNGATHSALIQAALVHAQFETIHPFTDGNGRVGRALIHTVLARRGLTPTAVLPISLVLATFRDDYVRALTAYRYDQDANQGAAVEAWLREFTNAVLRAATQADQLRNQIADLRDQWREQLAAYRDSQGRQRSMRSDSATGLVLADLPSTPVLTAATVVRIHGVSQQAASKALGELERAGIMQSRSAGRNARAYVAVDVLDLVNSTERRLASTRFDTRTSPPNRPVPAPRRRSHD